MSDVSLQSPKISLRPFVKEDRDVLRTLLNRRELFGRRYIPRDFPDDRELTPAQVGKILEKWENTESRAYFAALLPDSDTLIGHAAVHWGWDPHCPDVHLMIDPQYQRMGHGTECLRVLLEWVFGTLPAHNIAAWIADWNETALMFFEKQGFQHAGRSRREGMWRGKFVDFVLMDILRREWQAQNPDTAPRE